MLKFVKRKQRGQAMIVIAVCLLALLGLMALVVDTGRVYIEHIALQRAVDSAALAAAQDLPETDFEPLPYDVAREAAEFNKAPLSNLDIQFAAPPGYSKANTVSVTATKVVPTRMAHFLGYPQWPITAQAIARSGPAELVRNWIPIAILQEPSDLNGEFQVQQRLRLGNTGHTPANAQDIKRIYVPIDYGDLRTLTANTISSGVRVGQNLPIARNYNPQRICDGLDDRMRNKLSVRGCFKVDEPINLEGLNIIGPGVRNDWAFGEDPILMFIPFVEPVDQNNVRIVGFGLFYMEYAHFDPNPHGGSMPLTEIVGYFVRQVIEGPVIDASVNYGVIGIEYVDPKDLFIP